MLKDTINNYLQKPIWLSDKPASITEQDGLLFPWLADSRIGLSFGQKYRLTTAAKLREKDIAGTYYIQGVDLYCDDVIDALVITDETGNIIEEFIFKTPPTPPVRGGALSSPLIGGGGGVCGKVIARRIQNREQRIVNDILQQLELARNRRNMYLLLKLILGLELDPFTKTLTLPELRLLKLLINFGAEDVKTGGEFDFKKINFLLERLNNPWRAPEARTILQLVNDYENVDTIKEAENIFTKLGGIRNINLIIHQGKYHPRLVTIVKEYDLDPKGIIEAITETKKVVIELGV